MHKTRRFLITISLENAIQNDCIIYEQNTAWWKHMRLPLNRLLFLFRWVFYNVHLLPFSNQHNIHNTNKTCFLPLVDGLIHFFVFWLKFVLLKCPHQNVIIGQFSNINKIHQAHCHANFLMFGWDCMFTHFVCYHFSVEFRRVYGKEVFIYFFVCMCMCIRVLYHFIYSIAKYLPSTIELFHQTESQIPNDSLSLCYNSNSFHNIAHHFSNFSI